MRILRNLKQIIIFCTDIAEPTTVFDLLEFRWFRDWFRRSAISVDPGKKDRLDKIAKKKDKSDIKDRFGMMDKMDKKKVDNKHQFGHYWTN